MIYENIFNIIIHAYYYSIRSTLVEYYIYIYIHSRYKYKFYLPFFSVSLGLQRFSYAYSTHVE